MPLTTRRSSNGSDASRRYSLPSTIDSSTHVTKEKADKIMKRRLSDQVTKRRLSTRSRTRQQRDEKENDGNQPKPRGQKNRRDEKENYGKNNKKERAPSPPQTRSAKKKRVSEAKKLPFSSQKKGDSERSGLLIFSPPDQAANQRREKEELERKESERANRIRKARTSGQLLIFSPTMRNPAPLPEQEENLDTSKDSSHIAPQDMSNETEDSHPEDLSTLRNMEVNVQEGCEKSQVSFDTTQSGGQGMEQFTNELKNMKETIALLVRKKESSGQENRHHEVDQNQLVAQVIRTETLTMENLKLEEQNKALEQDIKEIGSKFSKEKERFLVETTKLATELDSARRTTDSKVQLLEQAKQNLLAQITDLKEERVALLSQVSKLEFDVSDSRQKLDESKVMLRAVREEVNAEKSTIAKDCEDLAASNTNLTSELEEMKTRSDALEQTIKEYEETIDTLENQLLPESEKQLQQALDDLENHKEAEASARLKVNEYEEAVSELKSQVETLRSEKEEERANFQALNEESSQAYQLMTMQLNDKDSLIQSLREKLKTAQNRLTIESKKVLKTTEDMKNLNLKVDKRVKNLEDSLADLLKQLEKSTRDKEELQQKLTDALDKIRSDRELKDEAQLESSKKADALKAMDKEKFLMLKRIDELEVQLKETRKERDYAQSRMATFNDREEELFNKLRESDRVRRSLHNRVMQLSGNIRVYVRVRPALPGEEELSKSSTKNLSGSKSKKRKHIEMHGESFFNYPGMGGSSTKKSATGADDPTKNLIEVTEPWKDRGGLSERRKKHRFGFDHVFNPSHGQEDIWEATDPLVQSAIDGFNVTIFAYGQTGSGKTFTMLGEPGNEGIVTRSVRKLFQAKSDIEALSRGESNVELSLELLEIYNEKVRDLLAPNGGLEGEELSLKITGNEVVGNVLLPVSNEADILNVLKKAQKRRCVKATASNAVSSRSHMLFTIHFQVISKNGMARSGKINICDLAGSERLGKSKSNSMVGGALLKETQHINSSLCVLSNVIEKLQAGESNIPFRESKLTYLLQNSLGGNSKTLAIVCCNPLQSHYNESLCSLRFAAKVNKVDLKAVANVSY